MSNNSISLIETFSSVIPNALRNCDSWEKRGEKCIATRVQDQETGLWIRVKLECDPNSADDASLLAKQNDVFHLLQLVEAFPERTSWLRGRLPWVLEERWNVSLGASLAMVQRLTHTHLGIELLDRKHAMGGRLLYQDARDKRKLKLCSLLVKRVPADLYKFGLPRISPLAQA